MNVCEYLSLTPLDPVPCTPPRPHIPLLGSTDLSVTVTDPLQSCTVNPPEHLAIQGSSTRIHDIEDVILVLKLLCAITSHLTKHLRDTTGVTELTTRASPRYHYVSNMWWWKTNEHAGQSRLVRAWLGAKTSTPQWTHIMHECTHLKHRPYDHTHTQTPHMLTRLSSHTVQSIAHSSTTQALCGQAWLTSNSTKLPEGILWRNSQPAPQLGYGSCVPRPQSHDGSRTDGAFGELWKSFVQRHHGVEQPPQPFNSRPAHWTSQYC